MIILIRYIQTFSFIISISIGVVEADPIATPITSASEISQPATVTASEKVEYSGEKISLNFQDTPISEVLQIFADFSGTKMIVSDTVTGKVTLRLDHVPWDQALDLILKSKGLDKKITNNVMFIAPSEEIKVRDQLDLASQSPATPTLEGLSSSSQHIELRSEIEKMNINLPTMINSEVELLSTSSNDDGAYFNYRLVNEKLSDLDVSTLTDRLRTSLVSTSCHDKGTLTMMKFLGKVHYIYLDQNKNMVTEIIITNKDCYP